MDIEIVGGLFDFYAQTEDILGICPENAAKARELRAKMPPLRVGKRGQLMEWLKDYDEVEPGHRHISHGFGLYPAAEINHSTPELFKAIERTMELRLASGGGHTGWSRAWLINLFARLGKADKAYDNVRALFTRSTLCSTHIPRSRLTVTSAAAQVSVKCLCRATRDISQYFPHFRQISQESLKTSKPAEILRYQLNGRWAV